MGGHEEPAVASGAGASIPTYPWESPVTETPTQHDEPRRGHGIAGSKGDFTSVVWLGAAQKQRVVAAICGHHPVLVVRLHCSPIDVPGCLAHGHRLAERAAEVGLPSCPDGCILWGLQDL